MNEKSKKKKAFRFLRDKWFYISLIIMLLLVVGALFYTFKKLDKFTRHGEEFPVPDMVGMNYDEALEVYQDELTFILLDSIYVKDFPEGAVYQQDPAAGQNVKKGRNVYIIRTNIAPEIVKMPNLRNLSLRQAMVSLNMVGLKVDKLEFVDYFARNAVIEQKIKDNVINPNDDVVKGSAVTLVVGLGNGSRMTNLPDLVGVSVENAKDKINMASLNIGMEIFIDNDEIEDLYVSRMEPEYSLETLVPLGSTVNVWYRSIKNFDFEWYKYEKFRRDSIAEVWRIKKYSADTIKYVIDSFNYILKNRTFSYDPAQRALDMKMRYQRPEPDELIFDFDDSEDVDNEINTTYFYDE
ncbi:MAG: PASTA domain-containing protein [Bacteroidales bacterium]|nr:PASTA domain-containing protein [Bacteroidales bacterium]